MRARAAIIAAAVIILLDVEGGLPASLKLWWTAGCGPLAGRTEQHWLVASHCDATLAEVGQTRVHAQQPPAPQTDGRLFPPIDLGLLESPDRAAWQKPEQIMDVLHVADGSKVADIGAGAGWFTIHLARRVGPNGV